MISNFDPHNLTKDMKLSTIINCDDDEYNRFTHNYTDKEILAALGLLALQKQTPPTDFTNNTNSRSKSPESNNRLNDISNKSRPIKKAGRKPSVLWCMKKLNEYLKEHQHLYQCER